MTTNTFAVKIALGIVALALYVLSGPINGGAPVFTFDDTFRLLLLGAMAGAFGWAAYQGNQAVRTLAQLRGE